MTTVNVIHNKKKKNIIATSIVLMIVLVLFAIVSVEFKQIETVEEEEPTKTEILSDIEVDKIEFFSFKNSDVDLSFDLIDSGWVYVDEKDFPIQSSKISSMLLSVSEITSERTINVTDDNFEKYGMDDPTLIINMKDRDGNKTKLTIGTINNILNRYYLRLNDEDVVYIIPVTIVNTFSLTKYELGQVENAPAVSSSNIKQIEISNSGRKIEIVNEGKYGLDLVASSKWYMESPFTSYVGIDDYVFDDYITTLSEFGFHRLADYNVTNEQLEKYGLYKSKNYIQISYKSGDGVVTYKLAIGNIVENEESTLYYVHPITMQGLEKLDSRRVYTMTGTSIAALINLNPLDYIFKQISYTRLDEVNSMEINYEGEKYEIEVRHVDTDDDLGVKEGENALEYRKVEQFEFYINDKQIDDKEFRTFFKNLISLSGENIIYDEEDVVGGDSSFSVVFNRTKEPFEKMKVDYISHDIGNYEAKVNGSTKYIIGKTKVKAVIDEFINLIK